MDRRQFMKFVATTLTASLLVSKQFYTSTVEMIYKSRGQYMIAGMAIESGRLVSVGSDDGLVYSAICVNRKRIELLIRDKIQVLL